MKGGLVKKLQCQLSLTEVAEEIVSFANFSFCPGGRCAGKSCNCYTLQKCHFDREGPLAHDQGKQHYV